MPDKNEIDWFDDGLLVMDTGQYAIEKYLFLASAMELFTTAMKGKWERRVYVDLYAGCGCMRIKDTGKIIKGSSMIALGLPDTFDDYIFCDSNEESIHALVTRAKKHFPNARFKDFVGDCNELMPEILRSLPPYSKKQRVLTFCFVDPPDFGIHFATLRELATSRIADFVVLLAGSMDVKRNVQNYLNPRNKKIDMALGSDNWRGEWSEAKRRDPSFSAFVLSKFIANFKSMGYVVGEHVPIILPIKRVTLYHLVYFSKHPLGIKFSRISAARSSDQLPLSFGN